MGEVVLAHEVDNLRDRHSAFCRHEHGSLLGNWRVHTDGHVAFALVEETLHKTIEEQRKNDEQQKK